MFANKVSIFRSSLASLPFSVFNKAFKFIVTCGKMEKLAQRFIWRECFNAYFVINVGKLSGVYLIKVMNEPDSKCVPFRLWLGSGRLFTCHSKAFNRRPCLLEAHLVPRIKLKNRDSLKLSFKDSLKFQLNFQFPQS